MALMTVGSRVQARAALLLMVETRVGLKAEKRAERLAVMRVGLMVYHSLLEGLIMMAEVKAEKTAVMMVVMMVLKMAGMKAD